MKKYFFYIGVAICCLSCTEKNAGLTDLVNQKFPSLKNGEILVIPNGGCSGCITDAENSLDSFLKGANHKVIFSQIQSIKTLRNRLSKIDINLNSPDIYVDTLNLYVENTEEIKELWGFPTKIAVNNSKVTSVNKF